MYWETKKAKVGKEAKILFLPLFALFVSTYPGSSNE
jgi:hypothetical protein